MSATSGISVHPDLQQEITSTAKNIRFLKIVIRDDILEENNPAYILAKEDGSSQWLLITYVPDTAKVREKMLYASSRSALVKVLTSPSLLSVSSKTELTPSAYSSHLSQQAAPALISFREKEMTDVQAAERADTASGRTTSRTRTTHLGGARIGLEWTEEAIQAVAAFQGANENNLLIFEIDVDSETLSLHYQGSCTPDDVASQLPAESPVFIYSCPSSSPIKHKMLYSSASRVVQNKIKEMGVEVSRKLETSDPSEVRAQWMKDELGIDETNLSGNVTGANADDLKRPFAKPKGPPRKNR
ncbi:hypothetical protein Clacol_006358 [Clathrus columnatus]|uniref:ADF-H domain-containing protein n=1 Tax=Clathrus columnatus TaxID=1419009 RepID=A0AAV5AEP0_9AGAM|nr:hypothetical protein Clacol_006358 [Clathrus columnatus]